MQYKINLIGNLRVNLKANKMSGESIEFDGKTIYFESFGDGDVKLLLIPGAIGNVFFNIFVLIMNSLINTVIKNIV